MANNSPAFQLYAENFLAGTAEMTAEEVGAYIRLLCHQWHKGAVPDNDKRLMQLTGAKKAAVSEVRKKFVLGEHGLINERLEKTRKDQTEFSKKQSQNAAKRHAKTLPDDVPDPMPNPALHSSYSNTLNKESIKEEHSFGYEMVERVFIQQGGTKEMAKVFFDRHSATDWILRGAPIRNFAPLVGSFITNWNKNNSNKSGQEADESWVTDALKKSRLNNKHGNH